MRTVVWISALGAVASSASAQVFTDRVSFESALGSMLIETFEDEALSGTPSGGAVSALSFTDFTVRTTPNAAKVLDTPTFGSQNTTPGGARYFYADTDMGFVGSSTFYTLSFPTIAFGFDYTGLGEAGNVFSASVAGQNLVISTASTSTSGFWGYIADQSFTALTLSTTTDSGYGVDQVTYTPAPAAALTGVGALSLALRRRRR